jgi:ABC-2 type transport system permease protein
VLSFTRERELGTLEQLLVMPFSSLEIIIGKSIPVILIGFIDFLLLLGITNLAFGVPVRGPIPLLLILVLVYILVELGKGLVISVISRTQHQAFLFVMIIGMVDLMFTGYAAPVESMPQVLQYIANAVPAHHMLAIMRGILLKGSGLEGLWLNVLALLVLGILIGTLSFRFVRRALD